MRLPWLPALLVAVAILLLTGAGVAYHLKQHRAKELLRLEAIAELKSRELADWLAERRHDAEFVRTSGFHLQEFGHWQTGDAAAGKRLHQRLEWFIRPGGFGGVTLLDAAGRPLWRGGKAPDDPAPTLRAAIEAARQEQRTLRVGPYTGTRGTPRLDFVAPNGAMTVVLHVDPADWLYRMLQDWPVPNESGDTVLVRREGEDVMFLNALRFQSAVALDKFPLARPDLPAARVLRGELDARGVVDGIDYRGVAVLGVARPVRDTDWQLLAKLDRDEFYRQAFVDSFWLALTGAMALFLVGVGMLLLQHRQQRDIAVALSRAQAERLRSLQLLDAIAENSTDAIFAKDAAGRYVLYNHAAERFSGKTAAEVLGRDDTAVFPPGLAARIRALDAEVIASGRPVRTEEVLPVATGAIAVEVVKVPLHDADGRVDGLFGIARDISERKRLEATLRDSEMRLRLLIDHTPIALALFDREMRYLVVSRSWRESYGIGDRDVIGRSHYEIFPDLPEKWKEAHRRGLAGEVVASDGEPFERGDGRTTWNRWEVRPWYGAEGGVGGIVVFSEDITAGKRAEFALRESEARFHDIVEASADWIWEVDAAGRYTYVSESVRNLLGYTPAEVIGRTPFDFMPPAEAARVRAEFAAIVADKASFRDLDNINVRKDGSLCHVWTNGMPMLDAEGKLLGYRGLDRDITERRRAEQEIAVRNAELQSDLDAMQRLRKLGTLNTGADHPAAIMTEIVEAAIAIAGADSGILQLTDPASGRLQIVAQRGLPQWWLDHWNQAAADEGSDGAAWATGQRVIVEDVEQDPLFAGTPALDVQRRADVRAVQSTPLPGSDGRPLGMISTHFRTPHRPDERSLRLLDLLARQAADIIERTRSEQALYASEESYRQLFEASQDALMTVEPPDWHFGTANTAALSMFRAGSPRQFATLGPSDVSPECQPDGRRSSEAARAWIERAEQQGSCLFEWRHRRLDGELFTAEVLLTRIERDGATVIQATVRDITARKVAETELKARNEELERFNRVTLGRELDMIEMKKTINALSRELGREPPYPLDFLQDGTGRRAP